MTPGWITTTLLDNETPGGWAVARSRDGFLRDDNGPLFPEWLKRQDISVFAEHGIGHLDGEPVYLLELNSAGDIPGCSWQGLRGFMLQGDHTLYKVLGYAAPSVPGPVSTDFAAVAVRPWSRCHGSGRCSARRVTCAATHEFHRA